MTRPTLLGPSRPVLNGVLGGSPEQPDGAPPESDCCNVDPAEIPDRANGPNGGNAVRLSSAGAAALVQSTHGTSPVAWPSTPTVGSVLLVAVYARSSGATPTLPTGYTNIGIGDNITEGSFFERSVRLAYRVADGTETTVGLAASESALLMEWTGTYGGVSAARSDVASTTALNCGGSVTPPSGNAAAIVGVAAIGNRDSGSPSVAPGTGVTELLDLMAGGYSPLKWAGYKEIATPSGSYVVDGTISTSLAWAGVTAVVEGTEQGWNQSAPSAVDGDDSTYETIVGPGLLRLDLGAAFRIVRTRVRIATTTAGARVLTIKAANLADFSDEETITTIAFTASGSLTAQDVTGSWYTPDDFRYWELSIDSTETVRVHSWELYEPTLGTSHQHDPGDHGALTGLADDDHPAYSTVTDGGGDTIQAHGATGATETIDPANGNVHTLTLDADCTITLTSPASGVVCAIEVYLTQDATGSRLVTWPGSVEWPGGTAPTLSTAAASVDRVVLETLNGGTTWFGVSVGGGGGSGGYTDPLTTRGDLVRRGAATTDRYAIGTAGYALVSDGTDPAWSVQYAMLTAVIDGGGAVITTGVKGDLQVPFNCTIVEATLLADVSGSIVVDVWKDTYANYPPTVADSITAAAKPTISSATKSTDATLTGWTTTVTAGDTIRVNVDSATTIQRATWALKVRKN